MRYNRTGFTFSRVPSVARSRSVFDRSRTYKTAFDSGYLIPFYVDEVLPGDTFDLSVTSFARLSTPVVPFMDNLWMRFFFFFVPNRLVWDNWQRFCGEQDSPDSSTDYVIPTVDINSARWTVGSVWDYFGLPKVPSGKTMEVNVLPFRAYNLIYNEWFRDENLCDPATVNKGDGPDPASDYDLWRRCKAKVDPFTSALPWPQKGPGVELPLGTTAPVVGDGKAIRLTDGTTTWTLGTNNTGLNTNAQLKLCIGSNQDVGTEVTQDINCVANTAIGLRSVNANTGLVADLTQATAATINSLREAFQVQRWYEQLARGGSRYVELVLSMFGVHTGDARLQRPEYLGGGVTPINVHAVAQTSATDSVTPQGNVAAIGTSGQRGIGFSKSFVEHGYVLGLVCVCGDYTYQQGLDRMWSRQTKFDFYWPAFAHLGEAPIRNKEIYFTGTAQDDAIFGYNERWYEYRYGVNKVTGKLRSGIDGSLDVWHLGQYFSGVPGLNEQFIEENPPVSRVLAVQDEPQFIFDSVIKCRTARCMPVYSVPGLIDHF